MGSKYSHVFSPIRIRGIDFKNRIVLAPPSPNLAAEDGTVTDNFINWFRMFARGGVGTIYVGNCSVDFAESRDEAFQLNMNQDRVIYGLAKFADMCKEYGCHASLELNHGGENEAFEDIHRAPLGASRRLPFNETWRSKLNGREPIYCEEMTKEQIKATISKYANGALRMKKAGMDIVLLHGGHGNLISQFTSPIYNKRSDEYGGSLENRARFAIEVCDETRRLCGEDFVIEFRISADEIAPEGMHFDETLELIGMLKEYVDIFNVSAGLHTDYDFKYFKYWCQHFMMEHGFNVHYAEKVKKAHPDTLVTAVGSINTLDLADEIIREGKADFVAMARALIADPDMPAKYAEGHPEDRRPCLRCDSCAGRLIGPKVINCAVNPMSGMTIDLPDGKVPKAEVVKRVAVIGAGPGGCQAAMTLAERGHDVTLYEKDSEVGGNFIAAAQAEFKADCMDYLKWLQAQVRKAPINLKLNTEVTREMLEAEKYDALIIAVGAEKNVPPIPGIDGPNVAWAPDAELGKFEAKGDIVVAGGAFVGLEAALSFARQGHKVTVVEMLDEMTARFNMLSGAGFDVQYDMFDEFAERGVELHWETKVSRIEEGKLVGVDKEGNEVEFPCDTVLYAMGIKPRWSLVDELRSCAPATQVYTIGDCVKTGGNVSFAVNGGFQAALNI